LLADSSLAAGLLVLKICEPSAELLYLCGVVPWWLALLLLVPLLVVLSTILLGSILLVRCCLSFLELGELALLDLLECELALSHLPPVILAARLGFLGAPAVVLVVGCSGRLLPDDLPRQWKPRVNLLFPSSRAGRSRPPRRGGELPIFGG